MKWTFLIVWLFPYFLNAQFGDKTQIPIGWERNSSVLQLPAETIKVDIQEVENLKSIEHASYICASAIPTSFSFSDFHLAELLPNGDKVYRLAILSNGALGMMFYFENFQIVDGAKLWIYDVNKKNYAGVYTARDNYNIDKSFMTSHVRGSTIVVEYLEPKNVRTSPFQITKIYHYFRGLKSIDGNGFGGAASCMLNAACTEGNGYGTAISATCRIKVTGSNFSGFCSGTLLSNATEDKTPYVLTANHCSANSTLTDLINWEFNFLYQSSTCSNPSIEPITIDFKGSTAPAYSGSDNGDNSSDFLLLKINGSLPLNLYDFSFAGWDRSGVESSNNKGFHHPNGDIKKVSTSLGSTTTTTYGNVPNTHFQVFWSTTTNGQSVTDEGSSGSGLFNSNGLLIGTLTGGASKCTNKNAPDFYGRLYMHWDKYGTANNQRLDKWLDPNNTGATSVRGVKLSTAPLSISHRKESPFKLSLENEILMIDWGYKNYVVNIYNILGIPIQSVQIVNYKSELQFRNIPKGIYMVEAISKEHRLVQKIDW